MIRPWLNLCATLKTLNLSFFRFFERFRFENHGKNLNLYQNTFLAMLITYWHSVHFINLVRFGLLQSTLVNFGPIWSTLVNFNSIRSIQSTLVNSVQFGPFNPIRSIGSTLVNSVLFGPIRSIQSTSIYSVHTVNLGLLGPIWPIRSS